MVNIVLFSAVHADFLVQIRTEKHLKKAFMPVLVSVELLDLKLRLKNKEIKQACHNGYLGNIMGVFPSDFQLSK